MAHKEKREQTNKIIYPEHYKVGDVYEVFNVVEAWKVGVKSPTAGFYVGTAIKYLARAGDKETADYLDDLRKARVYLQREIDNEKKRRQNEDN